MLNLKPYRLWVDCEHKTIKPDPSTPFIHHSCKLDPPEQMEGYCDECPYGKNPKPYTLPKVQMLREDYRIPFENRLEEAFWKCPHCERDIVYRRLEKEQWAVFTCPNCVNSYIDWSRAMLEPPKGKNNNRK